MIKDSFSTRGDHDDVAPTKARVELKSLLAMNSSFTLKYHCCGVVVVVVLLSSLGYPLFSSLYHFIEPGNALIDAAENEGKYTYVQISTIYTEL